MSSSGGVKANEPTCLRADNHYHHH